MFSLDSRHILHILGDSGGKHNVSVHIDVVVTNQTIVSTIILVGVMDGQHSAFVDGGGILLLAELKGGGGNAELLDEGGHTGSFHYAKSVVKKNKKSRCFGEIHQFANDGVIVITIQSFREIHFGSRKDSEPNHLLF